MIGRSTQPLDTRSVDKFRREGFVLVPDVFGATGREEAVKHVESAALTLDLGKAEEGAMTYRPTTDLAGNLLEAAANGLRGAGIVLPVRVLGDVVFDNTGLNNECLRVIPKSHTEGTLAHHEDRAKTEYFPIGCNGSPDSGVAVALRRGSVLRFSSLIMQRSRPNRSERNRRAWIIQFCPADTRSALSGKPHDDRLKFTEERQRLGEPYRDREFGLMDVLCTYQTGTDTTARTLWSR